MNLCPCLKEVIDKLFGKTKPSKSYEGTREFEQEEFINPHHHEISLSDTIDTQSKNAVAKSFKPEINQFFNDQAKSQNYQSDALNVKIKLEPAKYSQQLLSQQKDIEDLLRQELSLTPEQAMKKIKQSSQPVEALQQNSNINFSSFTINIDSSDPYFPLLLEKTNHLPEMFSKKGQQLEINPPNKTNLKIQIIQSLKKNAFLIKYQLNCQYSYYLSIMKNQKLFYSLSNLIAEAKVQEAFKPNLTLNTLKFKRIGSFQARDCYYIKYQNGSKREHWQIYINDDKHVQSSDFKTCELFCAKNIFERNEKHLLISEYLEIDFQASNVINVVPKLTAQLRDYLNNLQDYVLNNYEGELA